MGSVRWVVLWGFIFFLVSPTHLEAEEYNSFIRAKNAFDRGEYQEAVSRFDELIKGGVRNPALLLECHKLMGVSHLFLGDRDGAEKQFSRLLTIAPDYDLDPMLFPIEVIDFFGEVKLKNEEKLRALARARAGEEKRRKEKEAARRRAQLEALRHNVYYERTKKRHSLLVALLPLGAGQFQNGDKVKGSLFLTGELLLAAAAITTYFLHADLRKTAREPFALASDREKIERLELGYRVANWASVVGLGAVVVAGVIDSVYNFQRESVEWQMLKEKDVPEHLKQKKSATKVSLAPQFGAGFLGLEITGWF